MYGEEQIVWAVQSIEKGMARSGTYWKTLIISPFPGPLLPPHVPLIIRQWVQLMMALERQTKKCGTID